MISPRDQHRIDQTLAQRAEAAAELAVMYRTLLNETGDATVSLELTKVWIMALFSTVRPQPPEAPES